MKLKPVACDLTVCKLKSFDPAVLKGTFYFLSQTDEEISLVCQTELTPADTTAREDGWRAFRIEGILDFSLIGILSPIAALLAEHKIGIFVVSTFNTDYVLVHREDFDRTLKVLVEAGYEIK